MKGLKDIRRVVYSNIEMENKEQNDEKNRYKKTYCVDIDGTICSQTKDGEDYLKAVPFRDKINRINRLYDEGHIIIYYTSRGMKRFNGNIEKAYTFMYNLTKSQLDGWGAKYTKLRLGKLCYDYWIDDKTLTFKEFFENE